MVNILLCKKVKRAMPKNPQTTVQLCLFHMLARLCLKSVKLGFSNTWTENFQMYKLDLEKTEEPEIKFPTFIGSWRKQGSFRKTSISASLTMLNKAFGCMDHSKLWKILKVIGVPDHLTLCWKTCIWVKKQWLELGMEQMTSSNWKRSTTRLYIVTLLI